MIDEVIMMDPSIGANKRERHHGGASHEGRKSPAQSKKSANPIIASGSFL